MNKNRGKAEKENRAVCCAFSAEREISDASVFDLFCSSFYFFLVTRIPG